MELPPRSSAHTHYTHCNHTCMHTHSKTAPIQESERMELPSPTSHAPITLTATTPYMHTHSKTAAIQRRASA